MKRIATSLSLLSLLAVLVLPVHAVENEPASAKKSEEESPIQRLIEIRLDQNLVPARMINIPLPGKTRTLQDMRDKFKELAEDDRVGGVLLDIGPVMLSLADIEELRGGVELLKENDKKITAYLNSTSPNGYLLATAADEIVVAPSGNVMIPGIGAVFPFLQGHYQMLGVEFEVITAGRYKYPGFLNRREPDQFFNEEYNDILDHWIADYKKMIADGRKLSSDAVTEIVDIALFNADEALQRGLVDQLAFYDDCKDSLLKRNKFKLHEERDGGLADVNSIQDIMEMINEQLRKQEEARKTVGPKIAVLHARGPIIDISLGAGFASQIISRDDMVEVIDELRRNKSIKAVVMHVDSPGGSGYASDVIWRELRKLDKEKPLVVSMGSVAGSGGYYIACPARKIFAQPTTITGSIGVLGVLQSARSAYNRMDYEMAEMKRGKRATLGSPIRSLSKEDRDLIQDYMNDFYGIFIDRVAQTRRMPADTVRKIAEGRIYTGRRAKELGLVDELGGLADAIDAARDLANIPPSAELQIVHYPRASSLGELIEGFGAVSAAEAVQMFARGSAPAVEMGFEQQAALFAQRLQPLCWMAVPPFYQPQAQVGPWWSGGSGWAPAGLAPSATPMLEPAR